MTATKTALFREHFVSFARYNRWANRRLYDSAAGLGDEAIAKPRPAAYFGSILGTLNHVLVGDRIWLGRFQETEPEVRQLDRILFDDFAALRDARIAEDDRIVAFVKSLSNERVSEDLDYADLKGAARRLPFVRALTHFFNHQTHHRGQAHALIKDAGAEPPPLDYVYFLLDDG